MHTATLKLADIAARSLFVLLALFALPSRDAGQFGLLVTLIGLFGFLCGFERYLDLQRLLVGRSDAWADQLVTATLRFFGVNYIVGLPALAALLLLWVDLPWPLVVAGLLIAVAEHLASEIYRFVLVLPRHRALLVIGVARNLLLLAITAGLAWRSNAALQLAPLLHAWAALALLGALTCAAWFRARMDRRHTTTDALPQLTENYRASLTHFLTGLLAVAALQADRLLASSLLPLETAGVYFRQVFVAMAAYQAFGVLSHNRVMPDVYRCMADGRLSAARIIIKREIHRVVPLTLALIGCVLALELLEKGSFELLQRIAPAYLAMLMFGYLMRGLADYNSLLLNGRRRERDVLLAQASSLLVSIAVSVALTPRFGMPGQVVATLIGVAFYAGVSSYLTRRNVFAEGD